MSQQHVDLWNASAQAFNRSYEAVGEQWEAVSPCDGWNVQQVVDHAVGTQAQMVAGMLEVEIPEGAAWPQVHQSLSGALTAEKLEGMVEHPQMGTVPKAMLFGIATNDLLVHAWDVARSVGAEESLPAEAVEACYTGLKQFPEEMLRAGDRFGAQVEVAEDADMQTQLLGYLGRQP